eukprot:scaffold798_cov367-Pavlova_lutheri.AAC.30
MANEGVGLAVAVQKGAHSGQAMVGTYSPSLCATEADIALVNPMNKKRILQGIRWCAMQVLKRSEWGSNGEENSTGRAGTSKEVADYWVSPVSKSCHGQCMPLRRATRSTSLSLLETRLL